MTLVARHGAGFIADMSARFRSVSLVSPLRTGILSGCLSELQVRQAATGLGNPREGPRLSSPMRALQSITIATVIATGVAVAVAPEIAQAEQKFPSKPARIIVPSTAGSQVDTIARIIGQKMSEK